MLVHTINHVLRLNSFIQNSNRFLYEYIPSNGASILWLFKSRISIPPDARVFTFSFRISASSHHNCLPLFHLLFLRESQLLTASLCLSFLLSPLTTALLVECLLGNPEQTVAVCSLFVKDRFL